MFSTRYILLSLISSRCFAVHKKLPKKLLLSSGPVGLVRAGPASRRTLVTINTVRRHLSFAFLPARWEDWLAAAAAVLPALSPHRSLAAGPRQLQLPPDIPAAEHCSRSALARGDTCMKTASPALHSCGGQPARPAALSPVLVPHCATPLAALLPAFQ